MAFLFGLGKIYKDGKGRSPPWLVWMLERVFEGMWKFYDGWFKSLFGEGERTVEGDDDDDDDDPERKLGGEAKSKGLLDEMTGSNLDRVVLEVDEKINI